MNYYVYIYLREDGSPYNVGKGKDDRWKAVHGVEVPSPDRVIFPITQTTEEWAHFMEMEFIDFYGRLNDGTGILENLTDGGEGSSGRILSEETKQKISQANKGKLTTEETRRKISEANKGKLRSKETKQKISNHFSAVERTNEWKENIRKSLTGITHTVERRKNVSVAIKKSQQEKGHPNKGKHWWTDGKTNKQSAHSPGQQWYRGMTRKSDK
jgi:hypothetical protein